jgi:hypothetical protein
VAIRGWVFVQWPQFREDPQDVRPLLRVSVSYLQFQGLNEVLQDDHLLGEVGIVQKLPHVGPGFDERTGLFANCVMGCLHGVEFLELPLKLFPLTLQPDQSLLYETGCLSPHLGEHSQEVVDLGLHGREPLTN